MKAWSALRRRRSHAEESGFTILECVVAATVILLVMSAIAVVMTSSLADVAFARQRQGADGVLDKTIEQVRALPFATLQQGLDPTNDTTWNADPITKAGTAYKGQTILTSTRSTGYAQTPLVPHQTTLPQLAGSAGTYVVDVYPTTYNGSHTAVLVTVVVSWTIPARKGLSSSVTGQTVVYSPSAGCLAPTDHPFAAPCQPFFYADATSGSGAVTIASGAAPTPLGTLLKQAQLVAPAANVHMQAEQTSSVSASASPSELILDTGSGPTTYGGTPVSTLADTDAGTNTGPYQTATSPASVSTTKSVTAGDGTSLTLGAGVGDVTTATAASAASAGAACTQPNGTVLSSGTAVTTSLPCGVATATMGSDSAASATLGIPVGGSTVTATLASLNEAVAAFGAETSSTGGGFCTATSGDGCVRAAAARSLVSLTVGGLPAVSGLLSGLTGWTGGLLQISTTDQAIAESGVSPSTPNATSGVTVSIFNPALHLYVPLALNLGLPPLTVGTLVGPNTVGVTMSVQNVSVGSAQTTSSGCSSTGCETATSNSPLAADLSYVVTVNGATVVSLSVHVDLGTLRSATSYQAAPSAG